MLLVPAGMPLLVRRIVVRLAARAAIDLVRVVDMPVSLVALCLQLLGFLFLDLLFLGGLYLENFLGSSLLGITVTFAICTMLDFGSIFDGGGGGGILVLNL